MDDQKRTATLGTSILSRFIECSTRFPDNPAMVVDDRSYTYGELHGLCSAICTLLKAHGIQRGDRVGILTENTIYTYASLLGILACGACYVPLNYDNPVERNILKRKIRPVNFLFLRVRHAGRSTTEFLPTRTNWLQ